MSPPEVWGPPIWNFLHTLVEKIHDDRFDDLGKGLIFQIRKIVTHLPCPDCSRHAAGFFAKLAPERLTSKKELKYTLYFLHNWVNVRKNKQRAPIAILDSYKNSNVVYAYENFIRVYKTRGNMKLLTDSFQRQLIVSGLKKWLLTNIEAFR